jgi:hypothetical protein
MHSGRAFGIAASAGQITQPMLVASSSGAQRGLCSAASDPMRKTRQDAVEWCVSDDGCRMQARVDVPVTAVQDASRQRATRDGAGALGARPAISASTGVDSKSSASVFPFAAPWASSRNENSDSTRARLWAVSTAGFDAASCIWNGSASSVVRGSPSGIACSWADAKGSGELLHAPP